MKNKKVVVFVIITSIILIGIICSFISVNRNIITEKQVIKEMSESTQVTDLNNQITALNASHDEYAKNVQAYKTKIAEAITNQGVPTSADAKTEVIVENIGKILQEKTIATATAAQILKGQTAWVNGSKITGTMVDRGALNWAPTSSTTYNVPEGYYSGGTLNSSGAYNIGFNDGVTAADNRANANSVNYKTGYNNGYADASAANSIIIPRFHQNGQGNSDAFTQITLNGKYNTLYIGRIYNFRSESNGSLYIWKDGVEVARYSSETWNVYISLSGCTTLLIGSGGWANDGYTDIYCDNIKIY